MASNKLAVLLNVRTRTVDRHRLVLAACLRAEEMTRGTIEQIETMILREQAAVARIPDRPEAMAMFLRWHREALARRQAACAALDAAEARTALARSELAAARSAARVVEHLIAERAASARAEADRAEGHAVDDIARSRRLSQETPTAPAGMFLL